METNEIITLDTFCRHYEVTDSFIEIMAEAGWIEITTVNESRGIPIHGLADAEKMARLSNDLNINSEGIDVVMQLLQRIRKMQEEIASLKDELALYNKTL